MTAVEKPGQNYPLYYIVERAPYDVAKRYSGEKNPYAFGTELLREEQESYRKWISESGFDSAIVLDLHDNTTHPEVWPYQEEKGRRLKVAYKTDDGWIAAVEYSDIDIEISSDSSRLPMLREITKDFRPRSRLEYEINFSDSREFGFGGYPPFSETMDVSLEYYPLRILTWPNKIRRMSVERGLKFTLDLISHLRDNYPKYKPNSQST